MVSYSCDISGSGAFDEGFKEILMTLLSLGATIIFLRKYEKAGTPHTDKRLAYAKDLAADQG